MIYLALCDASSLLIENITDEKLSVFSDGVKEKILNTKNENEKKLRYAAYTSLLYLKDMLGYGYIDIKDIEFTVNGKPMFTKIKKTPYPVFNISHSQNYAVVAVSMDEKDIGIDIQSMPEDKEVLSRLSKRFLSDFPYLNEDYKKIYTPLDVSKVFLKISEDGKIKEGDECLKSISKKEEYRSLIDWSVLESALKMFGGGFKYYYDANYIIERSKISAEVLEDKFGNIYALSIAVPN